MSAIFDTSVNVQVRFTVTADDGSQFTDAIYLTPEEHAALKPADLLAMQQERYANWQKQIATPQPPASRGSPPLGAAEQKSAMLISARDTAQSLIQQLDAYKAATEASADAAAAEAVALADVAADLNPK